MVDAGRAPVANSLSGSRGRAERDGGGVTIGPAESSEEPQGDCSKSTGFARAIAPGLIGSGKTGVTYGRVVVGGAASRAAMVFAPSENRNIAKNQPAMA